MRHPLLRVIARNAARRAGYLLVGSLGFVRRLSAVRRDGRTKVERILVIRLDLLGDVLFSRQSVQGLRARYPGARICMLTLPYTAPLAQSYPELDRVYVVDTNRIRRPRGLLDPSTWREYWRAYQRLRAENFDLALSLSGPMASLWAALSGAQRTIGYSREGYPFLLTQPVEGGRYRERKHEVEYVRDLARTAGATAFPEHLTVPVSPGAEAKIATRLHALGVTPGQTLIALHAGSTNGSAKRWPAAYWGRFADAIGDRTGARVVLVGARGDADIARDVQANARASLLSLVGETDIDELVALLRRADVVATGDSGPLHLAVALGRPLLAVYGPTDLHVHGPFNPIAPVSLHRVDLACSPCYTMAGAAECPLGHRLCMRLVSVEEMVDGCIGLLRQSRGRATPAG